MKVIPFFIVWNPMQGPPQRQHQTHAEAKAEALRLAALYPGQEFFVLSVTGRAKRVEPVDWTPVLTPKAADREIPTW